MNKETSFVPKILLCGDETEFISRVVGQRPYKIVGHVQFRGAANGQNFDFLQDEKVLIDDKLCEREDLLNMIRGRGIDFIIFNDIHNMNFRLVMHLRKLGCSADKIITTFEFISHSLNNFYDIQADVQLINLLKNLSIKTLLDADAHFIKSGLFTKEPNDLTEIDCVCNENFFPLKENIFRHVYKNFSECQLKHYDAVLLWEKSPTDFDTAFYLIKDTVDLVITFARNGSELAKHIQDIKDTFKKVEMQLSSFGQWIFCYRRTPPTDFAMYVVTHKALPPEHVKTFPDKYKIIHAGRTLGKDLGYLGDDTGDNISELNPYINEVTALYWMWKNTSHTALGLCHYRRFFFNNNRENFLTEEEALKFLEDCDIIVLRYGSNIAPSHEIFQLLSKKFGAFAENIVRKNLMRKHPEYLDAFDYKMNSRSCYFKNMFVARRNVFDAYCEWFFSVMLDSVREILRETSLSKSGGNEKRLIGHVSEIMLTVWLMKNRLRVKEINLTEIRGL